MGRHYIRSPNLSLTAMKKNDWSTKKIYNSDGKLLKMEHTYNFLIDSAVNHLFSSTGKMGKSTYVYLNKEIEDLMPSSTLPEEKSLYASDLEFPLPWKEPVGANLDDSDEERKIKAEWFNFVKKRRLGKNWKDSSSIRPAPAPAPAPSEVRSKKPLQIKNRPNNNPNVKIHDNLVYEDWIKRRVSNKLPIIYKFFSHAKWTESEGSLNLNDSREVMKEVNMINVVTVSEKVVVASPIEDKAVLVEKNNNVPLKCDLNVLNSQSTPLKNIEMSRSPPLKNKEVSRSPPSKKNELVRSPPLKKKEISRSPPLISEEISRLPPLKNKKLSQSPLPENKERNDKKFKLDVVPVPFESKKTIFKTPTSGVVKLIKNEVEAVISSEWEGKKIDILFFKWNFLPKDREKLTTNDSLYDFLKIGHTVNFHGARTIPGTDMYETMLVYEGNNYPTLASRSGYNLKKWFIEKDLYTFTRKAVVKTILLPYHAAIDIDRPSRNSSNHLTAIMLDDLYINKDDSAHPDGWIDEFIKPGDSIFVELQYVKDKTVGVKRAWKFPVEKIINPRDFFIPKDLPEDKFTFLCKKGKSWNGTVRDVNDDHGIFLTKIRNEVYEIHFNQIFINGFEVKLNKIQTGDEICFTQIRQNSKNQYWCPRIWKGHQPSIGSLVKKYDESNRKAVVDSESIYAGKVIEFILPWHVVVKIKANNDSDLFVLISKGEIAPELRSQIWIDDVVKVGDVLTFKLIKLSDVRYSAIQVCS